MLKDTCGTGSILSAPADARSVLQIDLTALCRNWRKLNAMIAGKASATCASVVKADAYGLGLEKVVSALAGEGCNIFFVATLEEGRRARLAAPGAEIYILDGLLAGTATCYSDFDLRPVLSSSDEVGEWAGFCEQLGRRLSAAIHFDTGMRRLGVPFDEFSHLTRAPNALDAFDLTLLMSHLACADEPSDQRNRAQLQRFEQARSLFPGVRCSLANSSGIFLGPEFHFDVVRPGIALYGGYASAGELNPMDTVVTLYARILGVQSAAADETVGYGATHRLYRPSRLATVALGYADGFLRSLGGDAKGQGASAFIGDHEAPIIGRISMDLITLDVTDVPPHLAKRGGWVEMIGGRITVNELANRAGTIGYELLTRLGQRMHRLYVDD